MYIGTFYVIAAIGTASLFWSVGMYRFHDESDVFAAIAAVMWSVLVFASDDLEVFNASAGASMTYHEGSMQFISLLLTLVSLVALFGVITGKWPNETEGRR